MDAIQKEQIIQKLRDNGCRITRQREILLDIIMEEDCSCCKEIHYKALKQDKTIGIATVYRMINTLEEIGALDRKSLYRIIHDSNCEAQSKWIIDFEDGSSVELSTEKWNEVVQRGLEACGYSAGRQLKNVKEQMCDCMECINSYV